MAAPAPRPLTVPEQRALEALHDDGSPVVIPHGADKRHWSTLVARGLAVAHPSRGGICYRVTDRGRAYLRTLGVTE